MSPRRTRGSAALALIAGGPAILGAWTGGFVANDVLAILFFGAAAGAAFEVVAEVVRYVMRRDPQGLRSGFAVAGFLAGIVDHVRHRPARRLAADPRQQAAPLLGQEEAEQQQRERVGEREAERGGEAPELAPERAAAPARPRRR